MHSSLWFVECCWMGLPSWAL